MAAEVEAYFTSHNIKALFSELLASLGADRPDNVKAYLLSKLSSAASLDASTLLLLLQANQRVSSELTPESVAKAVIDETCSFLGCERATLFVHNPRTSSLASVVGKGVKGLVLPDSGGLTGAIFESAEVTNIADAYADSRFNPEVDQKTGYTTRSIIGAQIHDRSGKPVGVLMAINKRDGPFTERDEQIFQILRAQAGTAFVNSWEHELATQNERRAHALLNMVKALQKDLPAQSFAYGLSHNIRDLIGAHGCSVFVVDSAHEILLSLATDSIRELRQPLAQSIAGSVVLSGTSVVLDNAARDSRYNSQVDQKATFRTESLLAVPIFDSEKKTVVGVIEAFNKRLSADFGDLQNYDSFTESDVELLQLFGDVIGRKLTDTFSSMLSRSDLPINEEAVTFQSEFGKATKRKTLPPGAIPEGEEGPE